MWAPRQLPRCWNVAGRIDPVNRTARDARVCVGFGLDAFGPGREQRVVADRDSGR